MTGWMVYEAHNIARNQFFIDRWMQATKARGVQLRLVTVQQMAYGVMGDAPFLQVDGHSERPDYVLMRAARPGLSEHLESMGIPCFNNAHVARVAGDKRRTHAAFAGILPMMDTAFVSQDAFTNPFPYPVVVKGAHGCGGREVYLARDEEEYRRAVANIAPDSLVVQPLCDQPGQDVRVYVLGQQVVATMLRFSDGDFRSNLGQGGGSRPIEMPDDIRRYVRIVQERFDFSLVGIDFIFHQGRAVFNEIEDAVGTRMLYMHTGRDIAAEYLDLILSRLHM